ncbi:MAG: M23 family metallopeptidase [Patescibacteria group bacterium]
MHYPVDETIKVIQEYGLTEYAKQHKEFYKAFGGIHSGVDFDTPVDSNVFSALEGIVTRREWHKGMGFILGVRTGNILVLYAHLNKFLVDLGETVTPGQKMALSGDSGCACTKPHVHVEFRDLIQPTLKSKIFKPDFTLELPKQHTNVFEYLIKDEKTIQDISVKFFGNLNHVEKLVQKNKILQSFKPNEELPIGTIIKIYA